MSILRELQPSRFLSLIRFTLITGLVVLSVWASAAAQNLSGRPSRAEIFMKAGFITAMDMTGSRELETGVGGSLQMGANFPSGGRLFIPVAFDFHNINISRENQIFIEPSVGLKYSVFFPQSQITIRPGAAVGFGYLSDQGDLRASQYFTYKLTFEALFRMDPKRAWIAELSLFDAPTGSSQGESVKLGPGFILRAGVMFR